MQIPISKTIFGQKEFDNIIKPLKSGWVVQGPYVKEFEEKWSRFTGAKHSIATSNCTTALQLTLAALGVGQGDEVIIPSFTWVATANSVEAVGARPILCDIDLLTFNINVREINKLVSKRTKVIIPVHQFGMPAEMGEIMNLASQNNLHVVEDGACAFGTRYKGQHVGTFGKAGCFSFHPRKAITTGEGGMITTNDKDFASKLSSMRDHGAKVSDYERANGKKPYFLADYPYAGFNYRMTDIQGAIGSSQMDTAEEILSRRKSIARKYDALFDKIEWIERPSCPNENEHGYQSYVCLFRPTKPSMSNVDLISSKRNSFMQYFQENGISTRPGTHAVHLLNYYVDKYGYKPADFPNSWIANRCSIAFPLYTSLSDEEFDFIANKALEYQIS